MAFLSGVETRDAVPPRTRAFVLWALVGVLFVSSVVPGFARGAGPGPNHASGLVAHPTIVIEGDRNFTADNGVVGGTGTWYDPYRIEGWAINGTEGDGVAIRNTTAYFILRGLRITDCARYCVDLTAAQNGVIVACYLEAVVDPMTLRDAAGVRAHNVSRVAILNTTMAGPGYGLGILGSSSVTIRGNRILGDPARAPFGGMSIQDSRDVDVRANLVGYHAFGALFYGSAVVNVSTNRIWDDGTGMILLRTSNASVWGNHIAWQDVGIRVEQSSNLTVAGNAVTDIHGSYPYGRPVSLNHTTGARIYRNDLLSSGNPFDDMGAQNAWDDGYPTGGNWWGMGFAPDNCSGPGQDVCTDPDGIQDAPFPFDANSTDRYPFAGPIAHVDLPPVPSFVVSPSSGDTATIYEANASASLDLESNLGLSYRWDWQDDGIWDTGWSSDPTADHRFTEPGSFTVRLEVRDLAGLTDETTLLLSVRLAPDRTTPSVLHTPTPTAYVNEVIQVNVTATDPAGLANVTLYYAPAGSDSFGSVRMVSLAPPVYRAVIPASPTPGTVRYYIVAVDNAGNAAQIPSTGTYNVTVSAVPVADSSAAYVVVVLSVGAAVIVGALFLHMRRRRRTFPPGNP